MSTMDWVFAGAIIVVAVRCFVRGFVREVLSVAAYAVGLVAGLLFSNTLIEYGATKLGTGNLPPAAQYVIAFVVCFIIGFLIMKLIEKLIREGLQAAKLEVFDRILGLVLGLAEGLLLVAFVLVVMDIQPFFDATPLFSTSLFAQTILPIIGPAISETLKPSFEAPPAGSFDLLGLLGGKK